MEGDDGRHGSSLAHSVAACLPSSTQLMGLRAPLFSHLALPFCHVHGSVPAGFNACFPLCTFQFPRARLLCTTRNLTYCEAPCFDVPCLLGLTPLQFDLFVCFPHLLRMIEPEELTSGFVLEKVLPEESVCFGL